MLGLTWQSKPCILHGWKEFAEDHNLQVGDQVVFFLVAKSHFMVQVFDADNNAKRRTPVTDQYNNPNISVPKGKTNKFSKSIENDEETSVRMKCNLNLQPKRLGETGATNDSTNESIQQAKHRFMHIHIHRIKSCHLTATTTCSQVRTLFMNFMEPLAQRETDSTQCEKKSLKHLILRRKSFCQQLC